MADDVAIKVNDVSKDFILPHQKRTTLKEYLIHPFQQVDKEVQHALDGVSLEIKKGDFFGIVGRNGSGKSTLLKTIAGVYSPTSGSVEVNGKLVPFIELGVGFNPELTAKDNVYLNSALLGFSREETAEMYQEIVEFAELENHMDQKLKNFSSGMHVRLAFSIAIRAESDILLLDEVLAVGDEAFQKKCVDYFVKAKTENKTVILVTHDMTNIERFCDKVLVVDGGQSRGVSGPFEAKKLYEQLNREQTQSKTNKTAQKRWGSREVELTEVLINNGASGPYVVGEPLKVSFEMESAGGSPRPVVVGFAVEDEVGQNISGPNSSLHDFNSNQTFHYETSRLPLNPGRYKLRVAVYDENVVNEYDHIEEAVEFEVVSNSRHQVHGKIDLLGKWSTSSE